MGMPYFFLFPLVGFCICKFRESKSLGEFAGIGESEKEDLNVDETRGLFKNLQFNITMQQLKSIHISSGFAIV